MNRHWLLVSSQLQGYLFGFLALSLSSCVLYSWFTSLSEWLNSGALDPLGITLFVSFIMWPFILFRPLVALYFGFYRCAKPMYRLSLRFHDEIFHALNLEGKHTDYGRLLNFSLLSAFWIGVALAVPFIVGAVVYFLLLFLGDVMAIIGSYCAYSYTFVVVNHFYNDMLEAKRQSYRRKSSYRPTL